MSDESLTATFVRNRKVADQADLDAWLRETPPPEALGPPSPKPGQMAQPEKAKPGALAKGFEVTKEVAREGFYNFVQGLQNRPKGFSDWEGHGQQVLGIMQLIGALPAGAGAAVRQAIEGAASTVQPGSENQVAIKGGKAGEDTWAGWVRSVLAAPSLVLDPKLKKAIKENPEPAAAALNEDITYGELFDLITQFVTQGAMAKAGGRLVGAGRAPAPQEYGPQRPAVHGELIENTTPYGPPSPQPPQALPGGPQPGLLGPAQPEPLVTPPPSMSSSFETRLRAAQMQGGDAYARAVADELHNAMTQQPEAPTFAERLYRAYEEPAAPVTGKAPEAAPGELVGPRGEPVKAETPPDVERARLRAFERTKLDAPARSAEAPEGGQQPPSSVPQGALATAVERAMTRSEQIIGEAMGAVKGRATARAEAPKAEPAAAPMEPTAPSAAAAPEAPAPAGPPTWKKKKDPLEGGYTVTYGGKTYEVYWDQQSQSWRSLPLVNKGGGTPVDFVGFNKAEVAQEIVSGGLDQKLARYGVKPPETPAAPMAPAAPQDPDFARAFHAESQVYPDLNPHDFTGRVIKPTRDAAGQLEAPKETLADPDRWYETKEGWWLERRAGAPTAGGPAGPTRPMEAPPAPAASAAPMAPPEAPAAPAAPAAAPEAPTEFGGVKIEPATTLGGMSKEQIDSVMGTLDLMHTELKEAAPGSRHFVTDDVGKVTDVLRQPSTYPKFMESVGLKKTRANADKLMKVIDDIQAGKVDTPLHERMVQYAADHWEEWSGRWEVGTADPKLMARMALGAAAGGTQGDTAEDRIRNMFLGMGIGAALSAKTARSLVDAYKQSGLADESGAINWSRFRPTTRARAQEGERAYQPNYRRLDITPDVANFTKQLHRAIKEDILNRAGPARSNQVRVQEAGEMIRSGRFDAERALTLGDKEMLTDTEITAARMLGVKARDVAFELRDRLNAGDATVRPGEFRAAFAVAAAISRNVRVAQRRQGQALQANAIKINGEGVGYSLDDVAHLADDMFPGMSERDAARLMSTLQTPEQMENFALWSALFPRMGLQGIYFSYLSGKAVGRNLVGNSVMLAKAPMDRGIARFMPRWGSPKPGVMPGEATQMAIALGEGLVDQLRMVKHLDRLEDYAMRQGVDTSVLKSERRAPAGEQFFNELTGGNDQLAHLGRWYDNTTTFPGKVLDTTDVMSKALAARMQYTIEAQRQATFEGRAGEAWATRVREIMSDPTELTDASRQRISEFADRTTFTQEFTTNIMRSLSQGFENEWLNLAYRGWIMPFFRITVNSMDEGFAHMPGFNFISRNFWRDWLDGGTQRQLAQARIAEGVALGAAWMYMESQGLVTGDPPKDGKLRKMWEDAGHMGRSWWDPVSGKYRSYDGLGALSFIVAGAANASKTMRQLPEQDAVRVGTAYVLSIINAIDSRSLTQGISNLMDVVKTVHEDDQAEKAMDLMRRQVAGWFKPGLLREIETMADPEIRRVIRNGDIDNTAMQQWDAFLSEVWSGIPGFSSSRDADGNYLIPPRRDRITGDYQLYESFPFNPFPARTVKTLPFTKPDGTKGDIYEELSRLNFAGMDGWPEWVGGQPAPELGLSPTNPRAGIRMTPQEADRYAEIWTKQVRDHNGDSYEGALRRLMESRDYWEQSDGTPGIFVDGGKALALRRIDKEFAQRTRDELFRIGRNDQGQPGALERAVLKREAEPDLARTPTSQQPAARENFERMLNNLRGLPQSLNR